MSEEKENTGFEQLPKEQQNEIIRNQQEYRNIYAEKMAEVRKATRRKNTSKKLLLLVVDIVLMVLGALLVYQILFKNMDIINAENIGDRITELLHEEMFNFVILILGALLSVICLSMGFEKIDDLSGNRISNTFFLLVGVAVLVAGIITWQKNTFGENIYVCFVLMVIGLIIIVPSLIRVIKPEKSNTVYVKESDRKKAEEYALNKAYQSGKDAYEKGMK